MSAARDVPAGNLFARPGVVVLDDRAETRKAREALERLEADPGAHVNFGLGPVKDLFLNAIKRPPS